VIVVGAGPAGLMLASELTLAGIPAVVLEKQRIRSTQSRAGALQPRTAEVLDLRGLLDPLLDRALPRGEFGGHFAGLPVELDCRPWRTRHPYPVAIPQARLEAFLEQRLADRGVPVLRGHEVTALEQDADGATAGDIRGSYLVACDGGHSAVRNLLGVPFPGTVGRMSGVVADITLASRSAAVSTTSVHFSQQIKTTAGFFSVLHPIEGDLYRLMFGRLSGAGPARNEPVTADEVGEVLRTVYGPGTELGELGEASRFSDASRQVERYREGRVLFAGDAAHIHLPIGGQGVNLGIQDAVNLGWKLAATVRGWAPEGLLDSYHAERHPVAARVLSNTSAQGVLSNPAQDKDLATVRDIFTDLLRLPDANRFICQDRRGHRRRADPARRLHRLVRHRRATARDRTRPLVRVSASASGCARSAGEQVKKGAAGERGSGHGGEQVRGLGDDRPSCRRGGAGRPAGVRADRPCEGSQ
jgi:2-polyprenyl-6-methoxyphenol hydroxylase-like FAD-dependent oxidoreductase